MATKPPPEERPSNDPPPDKKKEGWFDGIVQRSTGLPGQPNDSKGESGGSKSPWSMAGAGLQFAATTGIFALMGYYLDRQFGWTPWGLVSLTTLGFVGGMYLLIKEFLKDQQ